MVAGTVDGALAAPVGQVRPVFQRGPAKLFRDTWLVFQRQMLLILRTPLRLVIGFAQPIAYLLLFAPLLKSALHASTYAEAYRIYVPGLLVILVLLSGFFTGFSLLAELASGVIERSRVTPISRFALLLGRSLSEVATLIGQAIIITLLAIPFGLSVSLGDAVLAYVLLIMMGIGASCVSYAAALLIRNPMALGPLINVVSQPLALLSGVLLPLALAPAWLRAIAWWNPFYWATNGTRALFVGDPGDNSVWIGAIILAALAVGTVTWATRLFSHRVR
ncbi:MAG TPA: ABC transporter permease [Pseudonocardiaceae bacterium]|nr:ABC transporter permease [Pseudonocardiaceae bacterium]